MKDKFRAYQQLSDNSLDKLFKNGTIVLDTNILLNLYRYKKNTRDKLLNVLDEFSDRIWIPHHVGLEYYRNRLSVIATQNNTFKKVKDSIHKSFATMENELGQLNLEKRHSDIDTSTFLNNVSDQINKFTSDLDDLNKKSIKVNSEDIIKDTLEKLFKNSIGNSYSNQNELDKIYTEGEKRFKFSMPPGYMDAEKNENFSFGGLLYKKKFGDLIIWKQIIDYANEKSIKDLIFITDDTKTDWWFKVENRGRNNLGCRPELKDEILRSTSVERFSIYRTESFLHHITKVTDFLKEKLNDEILDEVREVSSFYEYDKPRNPFLNELVLISAVRNWIHLDSRNQTVVSFEESTFDLVCYTNDNKIFAYDIKFAISKKNLISSINELIEKVYFEKLTESFNKFYFVVINDHDDKNKEMINALNLYIQSDMYLAKNKVGTELKIIFGNVNKIANDHIFNPDSFFSFLI